MGKAESVHMEKSQPGVTLANVASELQVSEASVRNWIKTGYLERTGQGKISEKSYRLFKSAVAGGEKLTARANKSLKDSHDHEGLLRNYQEKLKNGSDGSSLASEYEEKLSDSFRNREGIYYTPEAVVKSFFEFLPDDLSGMRFCDPCCGSGNFLLEAIERGVDPSNIYGFDVDPFAVAVTRKRILQRTGYESDHIRCADFLDWSVEEHAERFDLILTNPPWGKKLDKSQKENLASRFAVERSTDTSSFFLLASLECLEENGYLGFLLQEAFFNVRAYETVRKKILSARILALLDFDRPFDRLMTKAQGLVIRNSSEPDSVVECKSDNAVYQRSQNSFLRNPASIFNFHITHPESKRIDHLYSLPHITLRGRARWGMGIVTGNNKKYLRSENEEGYLPVFRGSDIQRDGIRNPSRYLPSDMSLYQQVAPEALYLAESKLIYRFISSELVFFCDTEQRYLLNSANCLIPDEDFPVTHAQLAEILNSRVMNWLFRSIFNTRKILRKDLETLPIPVSYFEHHEFFNEETFALFLGLTQQ